MVCCTVLSLGVEAIIQALSGKKLGLTVHGKEQRCGLESFSIQGEGCLARSHWVRLSRKHTNNPISCVRSCTCHVVMALTNSQGTLTVNKGTGPGLCVVTNSLAGSQWQHSWSGFQAQALDRSLGSNLMVGFSVSRQSNVFLRSLWA